MRSVTGDSTTTRRRFLGLFGVGATECALCLSCGDSGSGAAQAFGDVMAGNVKDVPVGTLRAVVGAPAFLARDAGGIYAFTSTCTHKGCDVSVVGAGDSALLNCPCHGSQFDRNGAVRHGPASAPLVHFAVTVDDAGDIVVRGGMRVDAETRTLVAVADADEMATPCTRFT